jgi:glucose/arabinose dehydrogenase
MTLKWLVSVATLVFTGVLIPSSTLAHPPHAPYDDTRFAPITRFGPCVGVEVVATGLVAPLKGVAAPGQPNRLYVVDQPGILWAIDLNTNTKSVFLDVSSRLVTLGVCGPNTFDERGLLGIAFHPNYQQNGLLYTYTSEPNTGLTTLPTIIPGVPDHENVIAEWRVPNPGNAASVVDPGSRRELMRVAWPQFNHDGGDLAFGPDGKLYISMGDGGGADDADGQPFVTAPPHHPVCGESAIIGHQMDGNAQKLNTPLGKILRIDVNPPFTSGKQYRVPADNPFVNRPGAVGEIWAFGFRNPFRFSFDSRSGALFVGDVGQNDIEEVDIVVRGGNYGWNCKEGTLFFHINGSVPDDGFASRDRDQTRTDCNPPRRLIDPIAQYDTHHEGHSVMGGFVYHGRGIPDLRGKYVFGDFSVLFKFPTGPHDYGRLFFIDPDGKDGKDGKDRLRKISQLHVLPGGALSLALLGWGQDARGELYVLGNISGLPFPNPDPDLGPPTPTGRVLRLVPAPKVDDDHDHRDEHHDDKDHDN